MADERVFQVNIKKEIGRFFDDSSRTATEAPQLVLILGGICTGKTWLRKQRYARGYVVIDAADIFLSLSGNASYDFPSVLEEPMELIGRLVARQALHERRNIVTEMTGDQFEETSTVIDAMTSLGYKVEVIGLTCDLEEAQRRNMNRGDDNISAYYTQSYHQRWILEAVENVQKERGA